MARGGKVPLFLMAFGQKAMYYETYGFYKSSFSIVRFMAEKTESSRKGRPPAMPAHERIQVIFDAAERLFGAHGYERVTMAEIAAEAGMSKRTLYVCFADKQALLTSLVASSCIWEDGALMTGADDPVGLLAARLRVIARHVLSARHIRLCRLAIGESMGVEGLGKTFYDMAFRASRESLIEAVCAISSGRRRVQLSEAIMADVLFGASAGHPLFEALLAGKTPQLPDVYAAIEQVVDALFIVEGRVDKSVG